MGKNDKLLKAKMETIEKFEEVFDTKLADIMEQEGIDRMLNPKTTLFEVTSVLTTMAFAIAMDESGKSFNEMIDEVGKSIAELEGEEYENLRTDDDGLYEDSDDFYGFFDKPSQEVHADFSTIENARECAIEHCLNKGIKKSDIVMFKVTVKVGEL